MSRNKTAFANLQHQDISQCTVFYIPGDKKKKSNFMIQNGILVPSNFNVYRTQLFASSYKLQLVNETQLLSFKYLRVAYIYWSVLLLLGKTILLTSDLG